MGISNLSPHYQNSQPEPDPDPLGSEFICWSGAADSDQKIIRIQIWLSLSRNNFQSPDGSEAGSRWELQLQYCNLFIVCTSDQLRKWGYAVVEQLFLYRLLNLWSNVLEQMLHLFEMFFGIRCHWLTKYILYIKGCWYLKTHYVLLICFSTQDTNYFAMQKTIGNIRHKNTSPILSWRWAVSLTPLDVKKRSHEMDRTELGMIEI